jgi:hypothetical protein
VKIDCFQLDLSHVWCSFQMHFHQCLFFGCSRYTDQYGPLVSLDTERHEYSWWYLGTTTISCRPQSYVLFHWLAGCSGSCGFRHTVQRFGKFQQFSHPLTIEVGSEQFIGSIYQRSSHVKSICSTNQGTSYLV